MNLFATLAFLVIIAGFPILAFPEPIKVGDVDIYPTDFSAELDPETRIAKCLACHGKRGWGDIDFGPDAHYGTPSVSGMREAYLRDSLSAYKTGARMHPEMSVISSMLDEETVEFMARTLSGLKAQATPSAGVIGALSKEDSQFLAGRSISLEGFPEKGVPACMACHGSLGEGGAAGPRLAGQNALYIENQFKAFADGSRQTVNSALMQPVVAGLTDENVRAVAHYYSLLVDSPEQ